jgi:hypothetical protein
MLPLPNCLLNWLLLCVQPDFLCALCPLLDLRCQGQPLLVSKAGGGGEGQVTLQLANGVALLQDLSITGERCTCCGI